ncbi:MAG TPA: archaellin/type IV pilin N-terminal domain-containing protein [Methanomicrobiales archaeon]|nr:archaellin/type IV pilin N-terminal domain-containing protein [Methanomicrobiales archaeon]
MKKFQKSEAFTGLEAAIVLIAFVVVAAVFSYVVLGAGFFTTQKSQEVVYKGVQQATSNIVINGEVYGDAEGTADVNSGPHGIHTILFSIQLAAGGTPVDLNRTVLTYQNRSVLQNLDFASNIYKPGVQPSNYQWCIVSTQNDDGDTALERNEKFTIQANLSMGSSSLPAGEEFTLTIKPDVGAALPLVKTAPGGITVMNILT